MSKVKPVISWPGGKRCLLEHILPMIPEHKSYIEPFCGGLAVFLAKQPAPLEVINDTHQELVRFYRCVKYHVGELEKELDFVLNSRAEFDEFVRQPGLTDIQQAARWLVRKKN